MMRLVILISGSGSNLQAIIDRCATNAVGEIVGVISNRPAAYGLQRAQAAGIPTFTIDHTHYENRLDFDQALMQTIDQLQADLVVLAGFMRILTPEFVHHYTGRLLNIHPSLLPAYKGTHTHQRAITDQVSEHGASVHFVTPELDGGPVIAQASVPVYPTDTADSLAARVLSREHELYPLVIHWFCTQRLSYHDQSIYLDGQPLQQPIKI